VAVIEVSIVIRAPVKVCFDVARDIDLHTRSTAKTRERAIGGFTKGPIGMGQEVTWEAVHFGVRQTLISRITAFNPPTHFRDSQVRGAFARFDHDHVFEFIDGQTTRMIDRFDYTARSGWLGRLADALFLEQYMTRFIAERSRFLKKAAEREMNLRDR